MVDAVAEAAGADIHARLAIVVEELVVNLVEHAEGATAIWLALEPVEAGVRVVLVDDAASFDPRTAATEGPNEQRGGGAGLAMVRAWSRILGYTREGDRNRLELIVHGDDR